MAALGSLSAIARQRPAFMAIVVQAFESLHGRGIIIQFDFNLTLKSGISYHEGNWFLQADKKKFELNFFRRKTFLQGGGSNRIKIMFPVLSNVLLTVHVKCGYDTYNINYTIFYTLC